MCPEQSIFTEGCNSYYTRVRSNIHVFDPSSGVKLRRKEEIIELRGCYKHSKLEINISCVNEWNLSKYPHYFSFKL